MSATFVRQLRSNRAPIEIGPPGTDTIAFRVQCAELWDAVRVTANPVTPIGEVKRLAISMFYPAHEFLDDFVLKLRGWEILDEGAWIGESGIVPGSILLLAHRRRRPVH